MKYKLIYSSLAILTLGMACAQAGMEASKQVSRAVNIKQTQGFTGNYLSGQFAKASGDIPTAIRYLRQAHENAPANLDIATQLQGLLLLEGKTDEAIDLAEEMYAAGSKDPVSILLLTLREVGQNDMTQAAGILDAAFETDSGQLWLPLVSAWVDIGQKKLTKPLTMEELGANVGRAAPVVNYHLALINAHAGFTNAAAVNFKDSIEDAKNPPTRVMAALLKFYERHRSPVLSPIVDTYRQSHSSKEVVDDTPVIDSPKDGVAEVLYTMGSIMLGAAITQDAVIYLQMALYLQPNLTAAALTLGDAYSELRQHTNANAVYARVPASSKVHTRAQLRMAANYDQMGDTEQALALLDKMAAQSPKTPDALVAKGDLLRIHADFSGAAEAYTQAIKRIPALTAFHWPILFARGVTYERQGTWGLAEKDFKQALTLSPEQPDVMNYLGYSWLTRGEHIEEARAMLEKAVKARPNDPQIVDSMGWALYLLGHYADATQYLEKAVELMPADPTANDHLGDVYWRLGRKTEARYQWERSLTFSPEEELASTIRKKLKDGLPAAVVVHGKSPMTQAMTQELKGSVASTE